MFPSLLRAAVPPAVLGLVLTVDPDPFPAVDAPNSNQDSPEITWAKPSSMQHPLPERVAVVVFPVGALSSQLAEDVFATELLRAGFDAVSREHWNAEHRRLLPRPNAVTDVEEDGEPAPGDEPDILEVARAVGADGVITVTLLEGVAQRNVYDDAWTRIEQVRDEVQVKAASLTVVGQSDGAIRLAGYADFGGGIPLVVSARRMARGMIQEMQ